MQTAAIESTRVSSQTPLSTAPASPDAADPVAEPVGATPLRPQAKADVSEAPRAFAPPTGPGPGPQPGPKPVPLRPQPPKAEPVKTAEPVRQPAGKATVRLRHRGILALAILMIAVPGIGAAIYLWTYAKDQYVSTAGFSIRTESAVSPFDFLGAFGGGSTTTSKDMDILNNFINSQQLVEKLDKEINLQAIFSKPKDDPYYVYDTTGTIEDLVKYWNRMVTVYYDNTTGLMQLNVNAFSPEDAQRVAKAVMDQSSVMINQLAAIARDDQTTYSKQTLDIAESKLRETRAAMTEFRIKNDILDPSLDLAAQSSMISALTRQLVEAQLELQIMKESVTGANDPRILPLQRRVDIIQARIDEEQKKVGTAATGTSAGYAELVADYERLKVDQEFSERAYLTALASYDSDLAQAQHKQVYLATYEEPTLAQASTSPSRWLTLATVLLIGFLSWSIITMIYYALRDRR